MLAVYALLGLLAGQEVPPLPYSPVPAGQAQAPLPPLPPPPVPDPANPPKVIERPSWTRKPTGDVVARVYPDEAMRLAISGRAVVQCQVRLNGTLEGCSIVEETPAGMGFGNALLRLTLGFRMTPLRHDGVPVDGGVVKIPVSFSAPPLEAAAPPTDYGTALACVAWNQQRLNILRDQRTAISLKEAEGYARTLGAAQCKAPAAIAFDIAEAVRGGDAAVERLGGSAFQVMTCLFGAPVLAAPPLKPRSE